MRGYILNRVPVFARISRILRSIPVNLLRILDITHDRFSGVNTSANATAVDIRHNKEMRCRHGDPVVSSGQGSSADNPYCALEPLRKTGAARELWQISEVSAAAYTAELQP